MRWYLRYALCYRDLEEMMEDRGLSIDHTTIYRFIKRRVSSGLGFFSFNTARRTMGGYEIMNIISNGQIEGVGKGDIRGQVRFVSSLFSIAV